jgi:hypothetical protein
LAICSKRSTAESYGVSTYCCKSVSSPPAICSLTVCYRRINDGYHLGDDLITQLDAGYFLDQIETIRDSLETLTITPETTDDDSELDWLLDMLTNPKKSLEHFTNLRHLVIPQLFLFNAASAAWPSESLQPKDLPPKLETLEILYPQEEIEDWVAGFVPTGSNQSKLPSAFCRITLKCRDEVGTPALYFSTDVDRIWWELTTNHGIETYTICQIQESRYNLAELWSAESLTKKLSEGEPDEEEDEWNHGTDSDESNDHDELPDLIDLTDDIPDLIDPMD